MSKINVDLQRERAKCTFNIEELTTFMDGGPQQTKERKESGTFLLITILSRVIELLFKLIFNGLRFLYV